MEQAGLWAGDGAGRIIRTSVATLYSNLVTRPTGRAVRFAIERQIREARGICLSVLDFSSVGIVDFSCADEVVAKLLLSHSAPRPRPRAFFLASGVCDHHRESIEAALLRHGLLLVTIAPDGRRGLWGGAPPRMRRTWRDLDEMGRAAPEQYAELRGLKGATARAWLGRLVRHRIAAPDRGCVCSLWTLLESAAPSREGRARVDPSEPRS